MENVGVVGDLSNGCDGADVVEVGRNRRELREPQGEGDIVHVEQEQSRGQKETAVPMELDYASGSETYDEEEWDDVDEVRGDRRCHNCGMVGHFARDRRTTGKGKEKDEGKGYGKGKGKTMKGTGKDWRRQVRDVSREDEEKKTIEDTKDNAGRVARWGVDNVDDDDDEVDSYSSG